MKTTGLPRTTARLAGALILLVPAITSYAAALFVATDPPGFGKLPLRSGQVAWGDYDNDGFPDAYVVQYPVFKNRTATTNLLFRNQGNGGFIPMEDSAIGGPVAHRDQSYAVDWGDVNNDGRLDLILHTDSEPGHPPGDRLMRTAHLYLNQPGGRFTVIDAGDLSGLHAGHGSTTSFADYDQDGWLDIFLNGVNPNRNGLFHSRGDGSFSRVIDNPITSEILQGIHTSGLWTDMDGDGDQDLIASLFYFFVAPPSLVYRNDGAGQFTRLATELIKPNLGVANFDAADFNRDGHLDLVAAGEGVDILLNQGNGQFQLSQHFNLLWARAFPADYDNDGDTDILLSGLGDEPLLIRLLRNDGTGRFTQVTEAFTGSAQASGNWVDFDNDGFLDLFLAYREPTRIRHVLYKNQGNGNHWIKFRLIGTASNRSAFGAKIRVKATLAGQTIWQVLELTHAHASGDALRLHFGLGDATAAEEVRIEWPSGNVQILENPAINQIHTVTETILFRPDRPVVTVNGTVSVTNLLPASSRQWYFNGQPLEGETNRVLTLTRVQPEQTGRYTVVRKTSTGATQTDHVFLRVNTQFTKILEGEIVTERYGSETATWFDLDNDGYLDVLVGNSSTSPGNSLFRNNRDGTFTALAGSPVVTHAPGSSASTAVDFDNDGWVDLYAPHRDHADLFWNLGQGMFEPISLLPLTGPKAALVSASWADYNRDGRLDVFLAKGSAGPGTANAELLRNQGNYRFIYVGPEETGLLVDARGGTVVGAWFDFDNDGWQDILVVHSGGTRPGLYRNQGEGTFTLVASGSLGQYGTDGPVAIADYDNDGWLDIYQARGRSGSTALHRSLGNGTFEVVTPRANLPNLGDRPGTWLDYDNDGWLDLFVAGAMSSALYRNHGDGTFQSVPIGNMATDATERGVGAWADYDNNGFADLLLANGGSVLSPNHLYRNEGNGNHWLKVKLVGVTSNRDAIGARIRLTATIAGRTFTQLREISGNSPACGAPLPYAHFGLGDATHATTVRIEWPSGIVQDLTHVAADQMLTVTEEVIQLTCTPAADGTRILCRGQANTRYVLQTSSDLTKWVSVPDLPMTDAQGVATLVVPQADAARFYRAAKP